MNASIELIPLDEISADKAPAIYGANILDRYVEAARAEVSGEVPDLTTRKGRERIASLAAQVARSKTAVEKPGREYLKRIKELPKTIEVELREFVQKMDTLRDEVRAPLNEWQAAEDARIDGHTQTLDWLAGLLAQRDDLTLEQLRQQLAEVEAFEISAALDEFEADAARGKDKALTALREQVARREKHEAELAAIAKFQAEQAEREQKEREQRIAQEATERAQREAEAKAQAERDAAAQRERDAQAAADRRELELKLAAEQSAKRELEAQQRAEQAERDAEAKAEQAAQAERQRQVDEQARIEADAKAREADTAHKKSINNAALAAFIAGGMPEDCAKQAITLIAKRQIPAITISY